MLPLQTEVSLTKAKPLICGYKYKHLDGDITKCLFRKKPSKNKKNNRGFPHKAHNPCPSCGLLTRNEFPSVVQAFLEFNQKTIACPPNSRGTIVEVGISCLENQCCRIEVYYLVIPLTASLLQEPAGASPCTGHASQQGGRFQATSSLTSLYL